MRVTLFIFAFLFAVNVLPKNTLRMACYNVENLFDYENDSLTLDDEFTPTGQRAWTYKKYWKKLARISKTIAALGQGQPPMLIGLCEIENRKVLIDLTKYAPLKHFNYSIEHFDSPDKRGIDVALLYQRTLFNPIYSEPLRVSFDDNPHATTRDILYVVGSIFGRDTLHVFICHFPSRLGGASASESRRCNAAARLKQKTDEILESKADAKILIMGDFNDYPYDKSLVQTLGACYYDNAVDCRLYNLSWPLQQKSIDIGSHKHGSEWGVLDQIIVSQACLDSLTGIYTKPDNATIFAPDFLLEKDNVHLGKKPFRTYVGYRYNDGFSDHLPVYIDFYY